MGEMLSSVSPKGQVTLPIEIRRRLGIKPKDKVAFHLEGSRVTIAPARSPLDESYQAIPALKPARSWKEIERVVSEERAREAAGEGLT
jgi:AbrB family looped-hinge helix DNA binding protein